MPLLQHAGLVQCPPEWEYRDHPDYDSSKAAAIWKWWLVRMRQQQPVDRRTSCMDTRPFHRALFENLVPPEAPYFAGNYRGSAFFCLETCEVWIGHRPTCPPAEVIREMRKLGMAAEIAAARIAFELSNPKDFPSRDVKLRMVSFVAKFFVRFLAIHPYANGNGHVSRFLLNAMFGSFDFWLTPPLPVHERPAEPEYSALISAFQQGSAAPLMQFLLDHLN